MTNNQPSGWAIGWTAFAGITMIMMGIWWVISGLVAVFNPDFFVVTERWILQFDISTWGWVHLLIGAIVLVAGFFLFQGKVWARNSRRDHRCTIQHGRFGLAPQLPSLGHHLDRCFHRDHLGAHRARTRHHASLIG